MTRSVPQRLGHALGVITAAINRLDRAVVLDAGEQSWEANAALLVRVRGQAKALGDVADILERTIIAQRMAAGSLRDEVPVRGVGVVSIHRTANRKHWDHDGLATHVLDSHLSAMEGELPDPWEVKRWLMDAVGVSYWRTGVLKSLGIPVDEFCDTETGRRTVKIV